MMGIMSMISNIYLKIQHLSVGLATYTPEYSVLMGGIDLPRV